MTTPITIPTTNATTNAITSASPTTTGGITTSTGGQSSTVWCNIGWIADGYCDDINNNMECSYDGGDCCGPNANTQYCSDCSCLDPNGGNTTTTAASTTGSQIYLVVN